MKATYVFVLLLAIVSISEANLLTTLGPLISNVLRADIMDIIHCLLHNDKIIKDVNVIIDAILTKDFNNVITALMKVVMELKDEITKCINDPTGKLLK